MTLLLFTTLKSHEVLETNHSRSMASFVMPFFCICIHVHRALSNEAKLLKIAQLEIQSVCIAVLRYPKYGSSTIVAAQKYFDVYLVELLINIKTSSIARCSGSWFLNLAGGELARFALLLLVI